MVFVISAQNHLVYVPQYVISDNAWQFCTICKQQKYLPCIFNLILFRLSFYLDCCDSPNFFH